MASRNRVIQTVLRLRDNFTRPLRNARNSVSNFSNIVRREENRIIRNIRRIQRQFREMALGITKSIASISYKGLQKGIDMLKKFSLLGGTLGAASLGAGVFEGMDYETYRVQLITATKDTQKATKLMQNAIQFANKTPFETGTIIEATSKFESMGLSAEKWLSITADMAGATSKDMIQGVEAVIDAVASGEFERLKEFGLSKKTLEDLDTAGKVFDNKGSVISQTALAELLFSEMEKRYKGGAESLSKTTKGMWSTVTGVFKNSMAKIVGIMDDGTVRQGSLLDNVRKWIQKVADTLVRWQQDGTIEKISAKFDNFLTKCKEVFGYLKSKIDEVKQKFQEWQQDGTIDNLKEKLTGIFKGVIKFISKSIKFIGSFVKKLNWIFPIVLGIVSGIKTWGIVSNITAITTDLLAKKQAILNILAKIFNKAAWGNPWVLVIGAIVGAIAFLILNWDWVKEKCLAFWEVLKNVGSSIKQFFINTWNSIKETFANTWNSIKEFFVNTWASIKEFFANAWNSINEMINNMFSIFAEKFPLITQTFTDIFEGVKNIFTGIIDFFTNVFTGNWSDALESLKQIAKGVFDVIEGIFLAPFRFFTTGINWVIDKINSISIDVPEWVPGIGGQTYGFNIPKIPNFATGTSYHRGGLARINEGGRGEIVDLPNGSKVIPADKSDKLLNKNNNNVNLVVNINNTNNADEIVDVIVSKLKLALNNM